MGLVIPLPGVLDPHRARPLRHDRVHRVRRSIRGRRRRFGQAGVVPGDQPLHMPAQVVPQVPPVGDLHRARRTVTGAIGVPAGPVPADHLYAGVGAQPAGEVAGLPTDEHIHRPMSVGQIDQHRAVVMPAAQRELINTKHSHPADRRIRQRPDQAQQRRPAHRHAQRGGQPRPGPPGQGQPDRDQRCLHADAAPGVPLGQPRHLLDKRARAAVDVIAEEPTHRGSGGRSASASGCACQPVTP